MGKLLLTALFAVIINFGQSLSAQEGNYAEVNDVKIYYETHGEDDPLLMLHGFTITGKSWEPWIEDLSKDHKLIIPDVEVMETQPIHPRSLHIKCPQLICMV